MTDITAKVISDSIAPTGSRLITFQLRYPRFIHAEFMTHRVFSRNASSSRAIPVAKMVEQVRTNPAMPIHWGLNQRGMQAEAENNAMVFIGDEANTPERNVTGGYSAKEAWVKAANRAADIAEAFDAAGYHKQVVNRILEPFLHIDVVVTATQWTNWFALRDHKDAQPEIRQLAQEMRRAAAESCPHFLGLGEWHLPYIYKMGEEQRVRDFLRPIKGPDLAYQDVLETLIKMSAARCARVSYANHDGSTPSVEQDLQLYERLVGSQPIHASPTEHQARPFSPSLDKPYMTGNFDAWVQARKLIPGECQ